MNTYDHGHWNIQAVGNFNPDAYVGFLYRITRKDSGKIYIGKKVFDKRKIWKKYCGSCKPLLAEIEQIGKDQFTFEILELHLNKSNLNYAEMEMQVKCDVLKALNDQGERAYYNNAIGNTPIRLHIWTEEEKEKARQRNVGKKQSQETIDKRVTKLKGKKAWNKGISHTEETKQKISEKVSGELNPMYGKKRTPTFLGRKHTEESKRKMSESAKNRKKK